MSPIVAAGLASWAAVLALAGVAWAAFGATWGVAAMVAGNLALLGYHLRHLQRLAAWAAGRSGASVPEARGPWGVAFSALYRRVRIRAAHQRDLTQTIERMRSAADAIPDGMVVLDRHNRLRWANRRAQSHLGLDPAKDTGRPIGNVVRQPDVARYLERGDFSQPVVVESQREPGVTLSIQGVPFGEDERLLLSRDISRLQAIERMRRDFIANVSHELKTPLTVVSGFAETLRDMELDSHSRQRYLELMQDQARSMQRLVEDLLTLSGLENQGAHVLERPFPITVLMEELAAEARALSAGGHDLLFEAGPEAEVIGNGEELRSAFGNLVSNAVRYTPRGGAITVRWRIDSDGAGVFSVSDTGIGIAPEHIPRLTERFYRVDRSRSRATGGTGLGLAIVKHVLLRHDAELVIDSVPGKGSTFTVRLPARRVRPSRESQQGEAPAAERGATG